MLISWFRWVSIATCELSLVVGATLLEGKGLLIAWLPLVIGTGSTGFQKLQLLEFLDLGLNSSKACEIFPDQRSNPGPLHWQVDSLTHCATREAPLLKVLCFQLIVLSS